MNRRDFLACIGASVIASPFISFAKQPNKKCNVLIITADDMNWDSLGVAGCKVPNITPNLDKLASQGVLFKNTHIMTSICGPSRNALLSGRYPHCSGAMGHKTACPPKGWQPPLTQTPDISTYLHGNGFFTGAINKHSRLMAKTFDVMYECEPWGIGSDDRDPQAFYERTKDFINDAKQSDKPFFIYNNIIDPHWPWPDTKMEQVLKKECAEKLGEARAKREQWLKYPKPSVQYESSDIDVPELLPDIPEIREYLVPYFNSVKRVDDTVSQILKALDDSGQADNTMVIFLSDHGMTVPGGKWGLYYSSTRTPLIIRMPKGFEISASAEKHLLSSIDIMPTIIEFLGLDPVNGIEGKSFLNTLTGKKESVRDYVYSANNWFADGSDEQYYPSRAIVSHRYLYIWNPFVKDKDSISEELGGKAVVFDLMMKYKQTHPEYVGKINDYLNRAEEEFFDISADGGCWHDLADQKQYSDKITKFRKNLLTEMTATKDPELPRYQKYLVEMGKNKK